MEEKWRNLRELEAMRADLVSKLEKIEEKKATVSVEVYAKVKKEYEDKLKKIEDRLSEFVDLIKDEINNLRQEEVKLIDQEKAISLKLEEIELRYSIGEYDDESFKRVTEEHKGNLKAIATKLQKLRERIKWFDDFVEIKGLEESLEPQTVEKVEKKDIEIEEHILEEKPLEGMQLEEILLPEEAVNPEVLQKKEAPEPSAKAKKEGEKGVPCPKCDFINSLDAWYCEKCGAELLGSLK